MQCKCLTNFYHLNSPLFNSTLQLSFDYSFTNEQLLFLLLDLPIGIWTSVKFEYITSDNGNDLLKLENGHTFRKEAKFKEHTDWVCTNNIVKTKRCTARVAVNSEQLIKLSRAKHNHDPQ